MDFSTFSGVVPPVVTPLMCDGRLEEYTYRQFLNWLIDSGMSGLFINGSTGEYPGLTDEVRKRVLEIAVEEARGRVPILAGVTDPCVDTMKDHISYAASVGADAIVVSTPYYFRMPSQDIIRDFFRMIVDHSSLPVFIYNVPQAVKSSVEAATILEISRWDKVAGIKDSSCEFIHFQKLIEQSQDTPSFRIFQGSEFQFVPSMFMGAHGGVLGIANLAPRLCVEAYDACCSGELERARKLQWKISEISQVFWMSEMPLSGLKAAMSTQGLCNPYVTQPMPVASPETVKRIAAFVKEREAWVR